MGKELDLKIEPMKSLYSDKFDQGFWWTWLCEKQKNDKYIYNIHNALEKFRQKYNRAARQIAIAQKDYVSDDPTIEVAKICVPEGQIWLR